MKQHIQTLVTLLSSKDDKALKQHYLTSNEAENIVQLAHLFQQGISELSAYDFYQQLATDFIESKGFPIALIAQMKTSEALSFFTLALQLADNFKLTDHIQRNALHYSFQGNQQVASEVQFNYLRSMMLFESNDTLRDALCQRDQHNLTPIEAYLQCNENFNDLATHEFNALLALIEIQSKQQAVETTNYISTIKAVGKLCREQALSISTDLQRLVLIAIYFSKPIKDVVRDMH